MFLTLFLRLVLLATSASALLGPPCPDLNIITARGTLQPPGEGKQSTLVDLLLQNIPPPLTIARTALDYPATLRNYKESVAEGTKEMQRYMNEQTERCPSQKYILLGCSQGAHVIGDALGGGGGHHRLWGEFISSPPLPSSITSRVAAVILYGDPRYVAFQPFDVGDGHRGGMFPRPANLNLLEFTDRLRTYCNTDDPFCDCGGVNMSIHFSYGERWDMHAMGFVVQKLIEEGEERSPVPV